MGVILAGLEVGAKVTHAHKSGGHFCMWLASSEKLQESGSSSPIEGSMSGEEDANPSRDKGDQPEDGEEDTATLMHKLLAALGKARNSSKVKHL